MSTFSWRGGSGKVHDECAKNLGCLPDETYPVTAYQPADVVAAMSRFLPRHSLGLPYANKLTVRTSAW